MLSKSVEILACVINKNYKTGKLDVCRLPEANCLFFLQNINRYVMLIYRDQLVRIKL